MQGSSREDGARSPLKAGRERAAIKGRLRNRDDELSLRPASSGEIRFPRTIRSDSFACTLIFFKKKKMSICRSVLSSIFSRCAQMNAKLRHIVANRPSLTSLNQVKPSFNASCADIGG